MLISLGAVLVALAVIVTGACSYFSGVLGTYVGLGEAKVVQKPGSESWDTIWGGAGDANQCTPIADALTGAGFKVNDTLTKMYADNLDKVELGYNSMDKLSSMTYYIGEFPMSYYTGAITGSYANYHDAALIKQ